DHDAGAIALAETQLATGDRASVAATLAGVAAGGKFAEAAHRLAAEAALDAGDPAAALAGPGSAPGRARGSIGGPLGAAFALAGLGKPGEARALLGRLPAAPDADHTRVELARARLAERTGDIAGALAVLDPLIRAKPDAVPALTLAGYLLTESRQRLDD